MPRQSIKVGCYDVFGNFLAEFPSGRKAAESINTTPVAIHNAIKLGIKCGGFWWIDISNFKPLRIEPRNYRRGGKGIRIYVRPMTLVKETITMSEAVDFTGISRTGIRNWARRGKWCERDTGDYFFEFVNPEEAFNIAAKIDVYKRTARKNWKQPVALIKNGKRLEFESVMDAARATGAHEKSIRNVIAGRWTRAGGYLVEKL